MALDDQSRDTARASYVKGPPTTAARRPRRPVPARPEDWLGHARESDAGWLSEARARSESVGCPPAAAVSFHDGWTFHGSPPNERADSERRAVVSHMISTDTRWNPAHRHANLLEVPPSRRSRPRRGVFPVMWREDGHRTPWIDAEFAAAPARSGLGVPAQRVFAAWYAGPRAGRACRPQRPAERIDPVG